MIVQLPSLALLKMNPSCRQACHATRGLMCRAALCLLSLDPQFKGVHRSQTIGKGDCVVFCHSSTIGGEAASFVSMVGESLSIVW